MNRAGTGEVLLYKIDLQSERGSALEAVLKELGVCVRLIDDSMLDMRLSQCISAEMRSSEDKSEAQKFDSPVMIINGLDDETLDNLLRGMRRENCSVELKAAVTKHNVEWKIIDLFREIESEHRMMAEVERLNGLLRKIFTTDLSKVEPSMQMKLIEAAADANSLLNGQAKPTCEALQAACANIEKLLR